MTTENTFEVNEIMFKQISEPTIFLAEKKNLMKFMKRSILLQSTYLLK